MAPKPLKKPDRDPIVIDITPPDDFGKFLQVRQRLLGEGAGFTVIYANKEGKVTDKEGDEIVYNVDLPKKLTERNWPRDKVITIKNGKHVQEFTVGQLMDVEEKVKEKGLTTIGYDSILMVYSAALLKNPEMEWGEFLKAMNMENAQAQVDAGARGDTSTIPLLAKGKSTVRTV